MASNTTFGASIVQPSQQTPNKIIPPTPLLDSPALTPATSTEDFSTQRHSIDSPEPSRSPFYQKDPTQPEPTHSRTSSQNRPIVNEKDIEAGPNTPLTDENNPFTSKVNLSCNKECKMWPSKNTLAQSRKAEQKKKRDEKFCGPVTDYCSRFTKRQKLIMQIILAFLIIGVVVAIAVGITVAVNGTVYVSDDQSKQISES